MIDQVKYNLLGISVNAIDYEAAVAKIIESAQIQRSFTVSALAVHGVMTGVLDVAQGFRLNQLDLIVPDGQPVRWALNWLYGCCLSERVYGPTLMLKICDRAAQLGLPIALYGSKASVLKALSANLQQRFPTLIIADQQPSRFRQVTADEQKQISTQIKESGAKVVFVGLGCPRQEVWLYENRELLGMPAIAVGAAFDFHAGLLPQSPAWMQTRGLEWLFRLWQEPNRLWRRYLYLNPLYLSFLLLQKLRLKSFCVKSESQLIKRSLRFG